jgi:DnaK suppressor protein
MSDPGMLLRARHAELVAQAARLDADEQSLLRDRADATADDEHDPEGSTLSGEWSRVDALRRGIRVEVEAVAAALERLDAGTYGTCVRCGERIPAARLEVRPMAETCVACAT